MIKAAAHDAMTGGRIYDVHRAEIARAVKAETIGTDNRRHFVAALRYGMRVETPAEFLAGMKRK